MVIYMTIKYVFTLDHTINEVLKVIFSAFQFRIVLLYLYLPFLKVCK